MYLLDNFNCKRNSRVTLDMYLQFKMRYLGSASFGRLGSPSENQLMVYVVAFAAFKSATESYRVIS